MCLFVCLLVCAYVDVLVTKSLHFFFYGYVSVINYIYTLALHNGCYFWNVCYVIWCMYKQYFDNPSIHTSLPDVSCKKESINHIVI